MCGSLKDMSVNVAALRKHASEVGVLAEHLLNLPAIVKISTEHERSQVGNLIHEAMAGVTEEPAPAADPEAEVLDEGATPPTQTLRELLAQTLNKQWFEDVGGHLSTTWTKEERGKIRKNIRTYLHQNGVTRQEDMCEGRFAERAYVQKTVDTWAQIGGTLLESAITMDDEGAYDFGESGERRDEMMEAMKVAVQTVIPQMWLAVYEKARHSVIPPHDVMINITSQPQSGYFGRSNACLRSDFPPSQPPFPSVALDRTDAGDRSNQRRSRRRRAPATAEHITSRVACGQVG